MRNDLTLYMSSFVILGVFLSLAAQARTQTAGETVHCVLRHSAVAELDEAGAIDVHTTDNDAIEARIEGLGLKEATFNGAYQLIRLKEDDQAHYYYQPSAEGFVLWVYFKASHVITYAKLRAFPLVGTPSSYLMIAKCE
jgi:hypothetical protein